MFSWKSIPLLLSFLFSLTLSTSAQEVVDLIAEASCECIEELEDVSDFAGAAETCIQQAIFSNLAPILEEFDLDITDEDEATRIGEQIGMEVGLKLVSDCPSFMEMMMASEEFEGELMDYEGDYNSSAPDNSESVTGTFLGEKVTKGGFSYLIVEDEYGDKSEFLWMNPFSGDELVNEDLEGQQVTLTWKPAYIRNGKEGEYIKTKVISGIED